MDLFKNLKKAMGVKVGQKVALTKPYGRFPIGKVGWVCEIFTAKPHTAIKYPALKKGDFSVKELPSGGARIQIHGIPKMLKGKPTRTLRYIKGYTSFVVSFDPRGKGYGSIHLARKAFAKVAQKHKLGSRVFKR